MGAGKLAESFAPPVALCHPWVWVHWWEVSDRRGTQLEYNGNDSDQAVQRYNGASDPLLWVGIYAYKVGQSEMGWGTLEAFWLGLTSCLMIG